MDSKAQGRAAHPGSATGPQRTYPGGVAQRSTLGSASVVQPRWGCDTGVPPGTQGALRDPGLCCPTPSAYSEPQRTTPPPVLDRRVRPRRRFASRTALESDGQQPHQPANTTDAGLEPRNDLRSTNRCHVRCRPVMVFVTLASLVNSHSCDRSVARLRKSERRVGAAKG